MAEDIGVELYEQIAIDFKKYVDRDDYIYMLEERINAGTATMQDITKYSDQLALWLRLAIAEHLSTDVLPGGKMYYNIAEKILRPTLLTNYNMVNDVAARIQVQLDKRSGVNLKPQRAKFPEKRVNEVISAAAEPGIDEAKLMHRMTVPAENITKSFANDYVKVNSEFRSKAGFEIWVVRDDQAGCCEWCARLAGRYKYPKELPADFYRMHDHCKCTVEYYERKIRSRTQADLVEMPTAAELQQRRELSESSEPVRLSPEQAAKREAEALR